VGSSGISNLYTGARHVVSTSMFPDVVGDPEPPIGAGLCRIVDTDFREDLFPGTSVNRSKKEGRGYNGPRPTAINRPRDQRGLTDV
jgi:hypothetical protein